MNLLSNKTESYDGVVGLLREEHEKLKEMFERFEEAKDQRTKQRIVEQTLKTLTVHATVEEEVFYPAVREANAHEEEIDDLLDEALQKHHVAKMLIAELERMNPMDECYDAKFTVLSESVKHHIEVEESDIFPKVQDDGTNWDEVAARLKDRRQDLAKESGHKPNGRPRSGRPARERRGSAESRRASTSTSASVKRK